MGNEKDLTLKALCSPKKSIQVCVNIDLLSDLEKQLKLVNRERGNYLSLLIEWACINKWNPNYQIENPQVLKPYWDDYAVRPKKPKPEKQETPKIKVEKEKKPIVEKVIRKPHKSSDIETKYDNLPLKDLMKKYYG